MVLLNHACLIPQVASRFHIRVGDAYPCARVGCQAYAGNVPRVCRTAIFLCEPLMVVTLVEVYRSTINGYVYSVKITVVEVYYATTEIDTIGRSVAFHVDAIKDQSVAFIVRISSNRVAID